MSDQGLSAAVVKRIAQEMQALVLKPHEGINVILNEENICDVSAFIDGPEHTPFFKGTFYVKLHFVSDFPTSPPKAFFTTPIFHPNVSKNGEICVSTLKKDWSKDHGISHILLTIKCLLISPNPESALNEEAGKLMMEDYEAYEKHARLWTSIHADKKKINGVKVNESDSVALAAENESPKKRDLEKSKSEKKRSLRRL